MRFSALLLIKLASIGIASAINFGGESLEITGAKTFSMTNNSVQGNFSQFIADNPEDSQGFNLDQSLRINVDGNVTENISVKAALDDSKDDREQKEITIFVDGRYWSATLGDFQLELKDSEYTLYQKKVKGILVHGKVMRNLELTTILTRSEGESKSEEFMGKGAQEEYRLSFSPVVENSETIKVGGRNMRFGSDYWIDYEDGTIRFEKTVLPIESNIKVTVDYEYIPGGRPFKRSLMGFRLKYNQGPNNHIGFNYVQDVDNRKQPIVELTPESPKPAGRAVYSLDTSWQINPYLSIKAEGAFSEKDDNLFSEDEEEDQLITGTAYLGKLEYKRDKYIITHLRTWRSPKFFTIGKEDLSVDLLKWNTSLDSKPRPYLDFITSLTRNHRRIIQDPNPELSVFENPITVLDEEGHASITRRWNNFSLGTYGGLNTTKNLSENIDNQKKTARLSASKNIGKFTSDAKIELENFENTFEKYSKKDTITKALEVGYQLSSRVKGSAERVLIFVDQDYDQDGEKNRMKLNITDTIKIDYAPSRKVNSNILRLSRREDDYSTDTYTDTVTADLKVRVRPSNAVNTDLRYTEEHIEKTLRITENVWEDNPVRNRSGSVNLDLKQSKAASWNIRYNHRDEADMKKKRQEYLMDRWETRLKLVLSKTANSELKYKKNIRERKLYLLWDEAATESDKTAVSNELERGLSLTLRKAFGPHLTMNFTFGREWVDDAKDGSGDKDMLEKTLGVEHRLSKKLVLKGGITHKDGTEKDQGQSVSSKDWSNNGGLEYSPFNKLKLSLSHSNRLQDKGFAMKDDETSLNLDFKMANDTMLTSYYKIVDSGPKVENTNGYKAKKAALDVTVRF